MENQFFNALLSISFGLAVVYFINSSLRRFNRDYRDLASYLAIKSPASLIREVVRKSSGRGFFIQKITPWEYLKRLPGWTNVGVGLKKLINSSLALGNRVPNDARIMLSIKQYPEAKSLIVTCRHRDGSLQERFVSVQLRKLFATVRYTLGNGQEVERTFIMDGLHEVLYEHREPSTNIPFVTEWILREGDNLVDLCKLDAEGAHEFAKSNTGITFYAWDIKDGTRIVAESDEDLLSDISKHPKSYRAGLSFKPGDILSDGNDGKWSLRTPKAF